jgi:Lon-like protease
MRKLLLAGSIALILAALAIVPMPVVVLAPGPSITVADEIVLRDAPSELNGELLVTTVELRRPSAFGVIAAWLDDDQRVTVQQAVVPEGVDEDEFLRAQLRLFDESVEVATAVGVREAGYDVEVTGGGAQVAGVLEDGPADGVLREGDVIIEAGGQPVALAADLTAVTSQGEVGDRVTIVFRRGDDVRRDELTLAEVRELERPAIGVAVRSIDVQIDLPFTVDVQVGDGGGPSGGLMLALAAYDQASEEDLAAGRVIAGTGTIDLRGGVGRVGGIAQKVAAARSDGATVFVVGEGDGDAARSAAGDDLEVIVASTLSDAIDALRSP